MFGKAWYDTDLMDDLCKRADVFEEWLHKRPAHAYSFMGDRPARVEPGSLANYILRLRSPDVDFGGKYGTDKLLGIIPSESQQE